MKMLERFWFGCGHCHGDGDSCPMAEGISPEGAQWLSGSNMVLSSGLVFLLPLGLAILCAWAAAFFGSRVLPIPEPLLHLLGIPVGFFAGVWIAKLVTGRIIRKKRPECGDS